MMCGCVCLGMVQLVCGWVGGVDVGCECVVWAVGACESQCGCVCGGSVAHVEMCACLVVGVGVSVDVGVASASVWVRACVCVGGMGWSVGLCAKDGLSKAVLCWVGWGWFGLGVRLG